MLPTCLSRPDVTEIYRLRADDWLSRLEIKVFVWMIWTLSPEYPRQSQLLCRNLRINFCDNATYYPASITIVIAWQLLLWMVNRPVACGRPERWMICEGRQETRSAERAGLADTPVLPGLSRVSLVQLSTFQAKHSGVKSDFICQHNNANTRISGRVLPLKWTDWIGHFKTREVAPTHAGKTLQLMEESWHIFSLYTDKTNLGLSFHF